MASLRGLSQIGIGGNNTHNLLVFQTMMAYDFHPISCSVQMMFAMVLFSLLAVLPGIGNSSTGGKISTADHSLALGDSAYAAFDNRTAVQFYAEALAAEPDRFDALLRLSRTHVDLGHAAKSKLAKEQHYVLADSLARRCIALHPDSADAHLLLALVMGRKAEIAGGKTRIRLSVQVRDEALKALELNPRLDAAYHILGRWNYEIASLNWFTKTAARVVYGGLPKASLQEAALMYEKATEFAPQLPIHWLEYGRTLIKLKRYDDARDKLRHCLEAGPVTWEDEAIHKEARKLLQEIDGK